MFVQSLSYNNQKYSNVSISANKNRIITFHDSANLSCINIYQGTNTFTLVQTISDSTVRGLAANLATTLIYTYSNSNKLYPIKCCSSISREYENSCNCPSQFFADVNDNCQPC